MNGSRVVGEAVIVPAQHCYVVSWAARSVHSLISGLSCMRQHALGMIRIGCSSTGETRVEVAFRAIGQAAGAATDTRHRYVLSRHAI
jgi:hypothetical protein